MKVLIRIAYDGTAYCGYQVQPNGVTVQQKLNEAAQAVFGYPCDIVGCSRTDSGVHAMEFCATISQKGGESLHTAIPIERIPLAISAHLPADISVYDARWVSDAFHARYDVMEKEYIYRIYNRPVRSPFEEGRSCHLPKRFSIEDLDRMQEAARHLVGEHDFTSYMAQGSKITDCVRMITESEITCAGDVITYRVRANGFLYHMVRILAGTLVAVGEGRISPADIPGITEARNRALAGITMPPEGLYLHRVIYPEHCLSLDWEGRP